MNLLRAMDVVLAIADNGSMSAAARKLAISLPSVIRILSELEGSLGLRLFNRTTRRVALTEEGEVYCAHCRRILADVDNLENVMVGSRDLPSGTVSITAPVFFGERHVAPIIVELVKSYPELQVRLFLTDRVTDIVEEHLDIAVRIGALPESSLIARKIGDIAQLLCASEATLSRWGLPAHPKLLEQLPCIQINSNNGGGNWYFQNAGERFAVPIRGKFICNAVQPALDACINGAGFAYLFSYQASATIAQGKLVTVLDDFRLPEIPVSLLFSTGKLLTSRMRLLLDELNRGIRRSIAINPIS